MPTTYTTTGTKAVWGYDSSGNRVIVDNVPVTNTYTTTSGGNTVVTSTNSDTGQVVSQTEILREGSSGSGQATGVMGGAVEQATQTVEKKPDFIDFLQQEQAKNTAQSLPNNIPVVNMLNSLQGRSVFNKVNFDEKIERQLIVSELDYGAKPVFRDVKLTQPSTWKNIQWQNIPSRASQEVSYIFTKKEELGYAKGNVKLYYLNQGFSDEIAQRRSDIAYKSFKYDVMKEFSSDVAIGVGSNLIGAGIIGASMKGASALGWATKSPKLVYYGTRFVGMGTAGAFEGVMFTKNRVELVRQQKMTKDMYIKSAVIGGLSSFGAQVFIEQGLKGLVFMPKNIPVVESGWASKTTSLGKRVWGTQTRESLLYLTDPLEPVSDLVTKGASVSIAKARTFTFPLTFSNVIPEVKVEKGRVSYFSPTLNQPFSFTFTTQSKKARTGKDVVVYTPNTATSTFPISVRPKSQALSFPSTLPTEKPNNLPIPFTEPTTLPSNKVMIFNQPNTLPNVLPNTMPNVLPDVTPFPNVFTNDMPMPFFPPIGGGGGKNYGYNVRTKQGKGYVPSLTALGLGIKKKKGKRYEVASGLSIRPII